MSAHEGSRPQRHEGVFVFILYVILFGLCRFIPGKYGGGLAMLAVSILGLPIYIILFRKCATWWKVTLSFVAAAALAAGIAIGLLRLFRGHWP